MTDTAPDTPRSAPSVKPRTASPGATRRVSDWALPVAIFAAAGIGSFIAGSMAVSIIEEASENAVRTELRLAELDWADVDADGLNVFLIGTAPDEAGRFRAVTEASSVVDAARVVDQMDVEEAVRLAPPRFSIEILRNDAGIQLIGLVPHGIDREDMLDKLTSLAGNGTVSDLMETARHDPPETWDAALEFGFKALSQLPRSKVSVEAGLVQVLATTDTLQEKSRILSELNRTRPEGVQIVLNVSSPRPVITPFTLRFVKDSQVAGSAARLDTCSADTEAARVAIVTAARDAGLSDLPTCTVGMGVPTTRWAEAARLGIAAVDELGGGSVTFSDAEVTLAALEGTPQWLFDHVVGDLENALPPVFDLNAHLPVSPEAGADGPPEFAATLSPEGQVVLRGRLSSDIARVTTDSFAKAAFGSDRVRMSARVVEDLPNDWSVRVLAGIEALGMLEQGAVTVQPEDLNLRGVTGNSAAREEIARLFLDKLGQDARFTVDVTYDERMDPARALPSPEECLELVMQAKGDRKINFEPSSSDLDSEGRNIMDDIADVLRTCGEIPLEIQGHTDSQGSEGGNLRLSQARADAVLQELRNRRVLTASFRANGYGEATPIADNGTAAGREANRRIEFALIEPVEPDDTEAANESEEALALEGETEAEEPQSE